MTERFTWLLWPGVTMMVVASLASFAFSWRSILATFRGGGAEERRADTGEVASDKAERARDFGLVDVERIAGWQDLGSLNVECGST